MQHRGLMMRRIAEAGTRLKLGRFAPFAGAALVALLFVLQLARGSVYYTRYIQDVPIHLNGIYHLQAGEWPHLDFSTPLGILYYLTFYATTALHAPGAFTAVYANGLAAAVVVALTLVVGHRRMSPAWLGALAFYLGLVAISPRHFGSFLVTFNAA